MVIPNFFIVGAPKCGTTAWYNYLGTHPDIGFSEKKEPHYFNTDMEGFRWFRDEKAYLSLFNNCEKKIVGEASVQYLASKTAAENIYRFNPAAKILIFVRDYFSYLQSYHNQLLLNLDEDIEDFREAWEIGGDRTKPKKCRHKGLLDYKGMGAFSEQVERYLDQFPAEQIMIIRYEQWTVDPRITYLKILTFLGLDDDGRDSFDPVHEAKHISSSFLAKNIRRPPEYVLILASVLKKILGVERLEIAHRISKFYIKKGYVKKIENFEFAKEVSDYYENDARKLEGQVYLTEKSRGGF